LHDSCEWARAEVVVDSSKQILEQTKKALQDRQSFLHLKGDFHLTKTASNFSDVLLERDFELETRTLQYIESQLGVSNVLGRYKKYDPALSLTQLPPHYAMKVMSGAGSICSGANIFMFFPLVLGLVPISRDDSFGFEFVDIWKNIFQTAIFPCVRELFTLESQLQIHMQLSRELERTVFLAAVFHELGHEVGPWRVSPTPRPDMHLDGYELDVLGELSTDSLMILQLKEFSEIPLFIILQRLFWFSRRGFKENPMHGHLNTDNDAWIGLYLWNKFKRHGVISVNGDRLDYNPHAVQDCFQEVVSEIDALFVPGLEKDIQRSLIQKWQQKMVPEHLSSGAFCYPEDLRNLLSRCHNIIEVPQFFPAFQYHQINQIKDMCS